MHQDESVIKSVRFLAALSCFANKDNQVDFWNQVGYTVDANLTLFSIMSSAKSSVTTQDGSLEINKLAKDALLQTLSTYQQNNSNEHTLYLLQRQIQFGIKLEVDLHFVN